MPNSMDHSNVQFTYSRLYFCDACIQNQAKKPSMQLLSQTKSAFSGLYYRLSLCICKQIFSHFLEPSLVSWLDTLAMLISGWLACSIGAICSRVVYECEWPVRVIEDAWKRDGEEGRKQNLVKDSYRIVCVYYSYKYNTRIAGFHSQCVMHVGRINGWNI